MGVVPLCGTLILLLQSVVLGKRPYTEYDYSDVVGADVGQLQYASVPVVRTVSDVGLMLADHLC